MKIAIVVMILIGIVALGILTLLGVIALEAFGVGASVLGVLVAALALYWTN